MALDERDRFKDLISVRAKGKVDFKQNRTNYKMVLAL